MSASQSNGKPGAPAEPAEGTTSGSAEADPARRVAELEAESADLKDRLLRALAEQENARRRAEREREEAVKFAASGIARDLLATADNLRRAIASGENVPEEAVRQLLTGIAATERGLLEAIGKHGIRRINPLGEPFDPDRHEAMFELTDVDRPAGTVIQVLQPGYLHYNRLLRPAMVGVAKGGDADATAPNTATEESPRGDKAG
jgi:molecular chaperone GrpE